MAKNPPIRRVAVLGAGVMGSGIAAHCANAGLPVLLLDIVPPALKDADKAGRAARNGFAAGALKKLTKHKPAPLSHPRNAQLIEVGNFDDDLARVAECDLIVEAIVERLDIKQSLFARLETLLEGKDTIVASNTSGLRIVDMVEGRSDAFKQRFLITHFFNPARYMKLLELVRGPDTSDEALARVERWGRELLGKGLVHAKDTPNFIANRIGTHALMAVIHLMLEMDLAPEDVDAITGAPMGRPKSATFRTGDVVGLDTLIHVVDNCHQVLTADEDRAVFEVPAYVRKMVENGQLGSKTKAGFYKKTKAGIETLDPKTGDYRPRGGDKAIKSTCKKIAETEDLDARLRKLVATEGPVGTFAWRSFSRSLAYAARRIGEISDDVAAVDDAMRWGFNWDRGPFQVWDALGFAETYDRMVEEGIDLPASVKKMREAGAKGFYHEGKVYNLKSGDYVAQSPDPRNATLATTRRGEAPVLSNPSAEAWDLGDGVLGVTFKSKANSIDADVGKMLNDALDRAEADFEGVLIFNQGPNFCVGANLFLVAGAAAQKQWDTLESMVKALQDTMQRMRYAHVPVVAAPFGMTLGGGLEISMAANSVQAALETYAGFVEPGVGVIPGAAGNLNALWRAFEDQPDGMEVDTYGLVTQVFKNIAMATVATSAHQAQGMGYFRVTDGVSFDRERQLHEAKQRVIGMARAGYRPPSPRAYRLPGDSGIATLEMLVNTLVNGGYATAHDGLIARKLAVVLCGGRSGHTHEVTEQEVLDLEREAFVSLCGEQKSQERMQYMLMNNKPLRN
ncbi:MAG: 3-hydroxyacyl-CoA dehydrogenase/enoyl-CoA hydratase family protein [Myxococcota bacterium]